MEWKSQLTKTPYLVLFIVLITIGVGTASALITITLAGDVVITGFLDMTGDKISNVGIPTVTTDVATKGYVDSFPTTYRVSGATLNSGDISETVECDAVDRVLSGGYFIGSNAPSDQIPWKTFGPRHFDGGFEVEGWSFQVSSTISNDVTPYIICLDLPPLKP